MNDGYARAMFSVGVENLMKEGKFYKEATFVRLVRQAVIEAPDTAGIPAATRCHYLLEFDQ